MFTPAFNIGVIESRNDPLKLGRCKVRIIGLHTHDTEVLPTEKLPWAYKIQPINSGSISGIGIAPVGVLEGTWVTIQFIDPDKQMPFITGTLSGLQDEEFPHTITGFKDPNDIYPKEGYENDVNRLARNENIEQTIISDKEDTLEKDIPIANSEDTWNQSTNPYNASYPYNQVIETESGHTIEFDDTPESERIHIYHKNGTFIEIDHNGTLVKKITGDNYEILDRNDHVYIKGASNTCIDGTHSLLVKNTSNIQIYGETNVNIHNDCNLNVGGNMNMSVNGDYTVYATGNLNYTADGDINIKGSNTIMTGDSSTSITSGGNVAIDGVMTYTQSGMSTSASGETLETIDTGETSNVSLEPLEVNKD